MSLLHAARVRELSLNCLQFREWPPSSGYKRSRRVTRLLHAARVRENVLLHARRYRLIVYSSENSHRRLAIKGLAK